MRDRPTSHMWSPEEEVKPEQVQYLRRKDGAGPTLQELQRRASARYEWRQGPQPTEAGKSVSCAKSTASRQDRQMRVGSQIHTCVIQSAELPPGTGVADSSPLKKLHGLLKTLMSNGKVYSTLRTDSNTPM